MLETLILTGAVLSVMALLAFIAYVGWGWYQAEKAATALPRLAPSVGGVEPDDEHPVPPADKDADWKVLDYEIWKSVFEVEDFDASVLQAHRDPIRRIRKALRTAHRDRHYFPRRPLVLPKLMRVLRSGDAGKRELIALIVQDAALAADVLRLANSVHYRRWGDPAQTLGQAVDLLGQDNLRSLVAASLVQPVYVATDTELARLSERLWQQTLLAATAAQQCARRTDSCDGFIAHLASLLCGLAAIVVLRVIVEHYAMTMPRENPEVPAQAPPEVLFALVQENAIHLAEAIAEDWELGDVIVEAIGEQLELAGPAMKLSPLGRMLRYGVLFRIAILLSRSGKLQEAEARARLVEDGLDAVMVAAIWKLIAPARLEAELSSGTTPA